MWQENSQVFDENSKFSPSSDQVSDKFLPSLADLAGSKIASFDQVSDSLPTGVYEFDVKKPSDREEVGALKAVSSMLKNQRELLRQQKLRPIPSQTLIARYESEIELLVSKREALKKDKRMEGFAQ